MKLFHPFAAALTMAICALFLAAPRAAIALTPEEQANTQLVVDFLQTMRSRDLAKASAYLADDYKQHNPTVPTGKAGYVAHFSQAWKDIKPGSVHPNPIYMTVTQNDLVTTVIETDLPVPGKPDQTYQSFWFDIFRVKDGKIVEHWDGAQLPSH